MATLLEDMDPKQRVKWYQKHLYSISGGFKKNLSYEQVMSMLSQLADLQIAIKQELA